MVNRFESIRSRFTSALVWLIIPLEFLTFAWEPDSIQGKALLLFKLMFIGICYLLFSKEMPKKIHGVVVLVTISVIMTTITKGGLGVALLTLTFFLAVNALPRIRLEEKQLALLFVLLSIGTIIIVFMGMIGNLQDEIYVFDFKNSRINGNTYGVVFLSGTYFLVSYIDIAVKGKKRDLLIIIICIVALFLIALTGCRSAMLSLFLFGIMFFLYAKGIRIDWIYTPLVTFSVLIGIVVTIFSKVTGLGFSDESTTFYGMQLFGKALFSGRDVLWRSVIDGYLKNPIFGSGSDWLAQISGLSSAHNVYLGLLVTVGTVPAMLYLYTLLTHNMKVTLRPCVNDKHQVARICFMTSIAVAAFECSFTDSRINFLFLPLLVGSIGKPTTLELQQGKNYEKIKISRIGWLVLFSVSLIMIIVSDIVAPKPEWITDNTVDIAVDNRTNLLDNQGQNIRTENAVTWEWNEDIVTAYGTAAGTSKYDLYNNPEKMPDWYIPGHSYTLHFKSNMVTFRVLYYDEKGVGHWIVGTHENETFSVPDQACGMLLGVLVFPHEVVHEMVRPVLFDSTENQQINW